MTLALGCPVEVPDSDPAYAGWRYCCRPISAGGIACPRHEKEERVRLSLEAKQRAVQERDAADLLYSLGAP